MVYKKNRLLLFKKVKTSEYAPYRLYFAEVSTLNEGTPQIYTLPCAKKKVFDAGIPGGVYDINFKHARLRAMSEAASIEIAESDYQRLVCQDSVAFHGDVSALHKKKPAYGPVYYTFYEIRRIFSFHPDARQSALCLGILQTTRFLSMVLPLLLFAWTAYGYFYLYLPARYFGPVYFLLPPLFYFASMPFIIFLMTFFYHLSEDMLLHNNLMKWYMVREYIHRTGGQRMGIRLHVRQKKQLLWFGLITVVIYILFWMLA
jgi:hypothetical protein